MNQHKSLELKIPPVAVFFVFAGLMWLLSIAAPWAVFTLPAKKGLALAIAAAVPVPFFVAYLNRFQIIPEEHALASLFGSEYEAYTMLRGHGNVFYGVVCYASCFSAPGTASLRTALFFPALLAS
jgi:hypothetical protein